MAHRSAALRLNREDSIFNLYKYAAYDAILQSMGHRMEFPNQRS